MIRESCVGQQHKRHEGDGVILPQGSRCDNMTTDQSTGLASGSVDSGAGGSRTECGFHSLPDSKTKVKQKAAVARTESKLINLIFKKFFPLNIVLIQSHS